MKDQIVMSKTNGEVAIAVPLFRWFHADEQLTEAGPNGLAKYSMALVSTEQQPIAYIIDAGPKWGPPQLMNKDVVERNLEFLGDL